MSINPKDLPDGTPIEVYDASSERKSMTYVRDIGDGAVRYSDSPSGRAWSWMPTWTIVRVLGTVEPEWRQVELGDIRDGWVVRATHGTSAIEGVAQGDRICIGEIGYGGIRILMNQRYGWTFWTREPAEVVDPDADFKHAWRDMFASWDERQTSNLLTDIRALGYDLVKSDDA